MLLHSESNYLPQLQSVNLIIYASKIPQGFFINQYLFLVVVV